MIKRNILIVEDEGIIAAEIESTLLMLGYHVVGIAYNGDHALDMIAVRKPDLVILDINIKGSLNGIDIAHHINEKYKIPFIYLTSYADQHTLQAAKETLPYAYILKPFTERDLAVNIELAFTKYEKENEKLEWSIDYIKGKTGVSLTEKEFSILMLFKKGLKYQEMAEALSISINTVKSYQKKLYVLFEVNSRQELINRILE